MKPEDQLKLLKKIWGNKRRGGKVFLPWFDHDPSTGKRKGGMQQGNAFRWPQDEDKIARHLEQHVKNEIFFTPLQFSGSKRSQDSVKDENQNVLFADLDDGAGNPSEWKGTEQFRPTICWETSPGSYQAVWLLQRGQFVDGLCDPEGVNHRLTMYLGADVSGWMGNKVLRVPGSVNRKPVRVDENNGAPMGQLMWNGGDNGPQYSIEDFDGLPAVSRRQAAMGLVDEDMLKGLDARELLNKYWGTLPVHTIRKLKDEDEKVKGDLDDNGSDRSDVLWGMAKDIAKAGANLLEIVVMLRASGWNKHRADHGELTRLMVLADRALNELPADHQPQAIQTGPSSLDLKSAFSELLLKRQKPVKWIVQDVWQEGACGWMSASPKSFKSWLAFDLATAIATGKDWLGEFEIKNPGPVLVIEEEDPIRRVSKRFNAVIQGSYPEYHPVQVELEGSDVFWYASVHTPAPLHIRVGDGFRISSDDSLLWLREMIESHQLKMVMIDTLYSTLGADMETKQGEQMMDKALRPLRDIAHAYNCAILVVHHNRKGTEGAGRPAHNMAGSSAMHGWADAGIYLGERDSAGQHIRMYFENKDSERGGGGYQVDISSLNRSEPKLQLLDGYAYEDENGREVRTMHREKVGALAWAPYIVHEAVNEAAESHTTGSLSDRAPSTHPNAVKGPGALVARRLANLGATTMVSAKSLHELIKAIPTKEGKPQRPGSFEKQLNTAIEKGWVQTYDNNGQWKKTRYYSVV